MTMPSLTFRLLYATAHNVSCLALFPAPGVASTRVDEAGKAESEVRDLGERVVGNHPLEVPDPRARTCYPASSTTLELPLPAREAPVKSTFATRGSQRQAMGLGLSLTPFIAQRKAAGKSCKAALQ